MTLRGNTSDLVRTVPTEARVKRYPKRRTDGTPQGPGYFGELALVDELDLHSTELPYKMFDMSFPLLFPRLTRKEITHLVSGGQPDIELIQRAYEHAVERKRLNKSPFADFGEQQELPV